MGSSRLLFGLHRAGHTFPVKMAIRASSSGNDWMAVAEEVMTTSSFRFFLGESSGWRVQACCKSSQALLGIDMVAMRAGGWYP